MKNRAIDLFYQAEDYFFRSISKECLDFDNLATAYLTGVDAESLNIVYIKKNIATIDKVLKQCKSFYEINHSSWTVNVPEEFISKDLVDSLNNIGFGSSEKSVAMFIELNKKSNYDNTNDMTIHRVDDKLEQWMMPLIGAFESTAEVTRQYADVHESALKNKTNFLHFTLFKDKVPVSSLTLSLQANVGRIDDVGTLPGYQNQGYATHLMKHAINEAINLGVSYCFLEASQSGLSVYQKLGFKTLFKNTIYSYTKLK